MILALVRRSDSIPVKSEGTRVLVNAVKSLWSGDIVPSSPITPSVNGTTTGAAEEKQRRRQKAMKYILTPECASALANLVGRSAKYPLLVNEGVVALSLMATQKIASTFHAITIARSFAYFDMQLLWCLRLSSLRFPLILHQQ